MPSLSKPDSKRRLLIAGFGDLGRRLVSRISHHWHCHALRRSAEAEETSFTAIQADLNQPETLTTIQGDWDAVVYTATPSARTPEAYRDSYVHGLQNLLRVVRTQRLVFVSSTAVNGQDQGEMSTRQPNPNGSTAGFCLRPSRSHTRRAASLFDSPVSTARAAPD